jgi:hypothetical protein
VLVIAILIGSLGGTIGEIIALRLFFEKSSLGQENVDHKEVLFSITDKFPRAYSNRRKTHFQLPFATGMKPLEISRKKNDSRENSQKCALSTALNINH